MTTKIREIKSKKNTGSWVMSNEYHPVERGIKRTKIELTMLNFDLRLSAHWELIVAFLFGKTPTTITPHGFPRVWGPHGKVEA